MTQAVLNINGRIVPCLTIRCLANEEIHSDSEKAVRKVFDNYIKNIHGDSMSLPEKIPDADSMSLSDPGDKD